MTSSVDDYQIVLDKPDATFYPGDTISGRLIITTTKPIKCRGVRIRCEGLAHGHWHTGSGTRAACD